MIDRDVVGSRKTQNVGYTSEFAGI